MALEFPSQDLFSVQNRATLAVSGGIPSIPSPDRGAASVYGICEQSGQAANYPYAAGYKELTTSKDAAEAIEQSGRAEYLRQKILFLLRKPMTPKEVAALLNEEITSVRPRITELKQQLKIEEAGRRDRQQVLVAV